MYRLTSVFYHVEWINQITWEWFDWIMLNLYINIPLTHNVFSYLIYDRKHFINVNPSYWMYVIMLNGNSICNRNAFGHYELSWSEHAVVNLPLAFCLAFCLASHRALLSGLLNPRCYFWRHWDDELPTLDSKGKWRWLCLWNKLRVSWL